MNREKGLKYVVIRNYGVVVRKTQNISGLLLNVNTLKLISPGVLFLLNHSKLAMLGLVIC